MSKRQIATQIGISVAAGVITAAILRAFMAPKSQPQNRPSAGYWA